MIRVKTLLACGLLLSFNTLADQAKGLRLDDILNTQVHEDCCERRFPDRPLNGGGLNPNIRQYMTGCAAQCANAENPQSSPQSDDAAPPIPVSAYIWLTLAGLLGLIGFGETLFFQKRLKRHSPYS